MDDKINCFVCDKVLEIERGGNPIVIHPIYDGLIFRAHGNFGSTVFDPMPTQRREMLQVIICDDCIKERAEKVSLLHDIREERTADIKEFKPYDEF